MFPTCSGLTLQTFFTAILPCHHLLVAAKFYVRGEKIRYYKLINLKLNSLLNFRTFNYDHYAKSCGSTQWAKQFSNLTTKYFFSVFSADFDPPQFHVHTYVHPKIIGCLPVFNLSVGTYLNGIYLFIVNNGNTRTMREICSKLTMVLEPSKWRRSGIFFINFIHTCHIVVVFPLLTLNN